MFKSMKRFLCTDGGQEIQANNTEGTTITCDDVLRNIFEEKCSFSLTRGEVQNIQHAVEMMILFLLTSIYEQTPFRDLVCFNKKVIETLASVKKPHRIHEAFRNENILKVGSYYENTKNCYPDEFDYICVIAECDVEDYIIMKDITSVMSDIFHKSLHDAIKKGLKFPVGSCLVFDQYICLHGPAASLKFKYRSVNDTSDCRSIFVDLSLACRVSIRNELPDEMRIPYSEWRDVILETGHFLIVKSFNAGHPKKESKTKISITESEKLFMQNKMSEEHRRVYRLLKFIFNGDLLDEDLKRHIRDVANGPDLVCLRLFNPRIVYDLSSYIIKTLMFHHCHICNRTMETTDKDCIVAILQNLLELFEMEQNRYFLRRTFPYFETSFSVSVLTITGDYIEIADRYRSSLKIVEILKQRVRAFNERTYFSIQLDSSIQQITERIPVANELRAVGHQDTVKHVYGKIIINFRRMVCLFLSYAMLLALLSYIGILGSALARYLNHDSEYGFLGQGAVNVTVFGERGNVTLNFSQTPQADKPGNISIHFLCLDQRIPKESWLYLCGYKQNYTAERNYNIKTADYGKSEEAFCDAYSFLNIRNNPIHSTGNVHSLQYPEVDQYFGTNQIYPSRAVCVWEFRSCLNVTVRNLLGDDVRIETFTFLEKGREKYLHSFIQKRNILDCFERNKGNSNETEICCCDQHLCGHKYFTTETGKIASQIILCLFVACLLKCGLLKFTCSGISSGIRYIWLKRRLRRGNIQVQET